MGTAISGGKPLVIGLTGGIASGKSTVAALFGKLGVPILDADLLTRELVAPGQPALREIADCFGPEFLNENGELDRSRLRQRVFSDLEARKRLEGILHPRVYTAIRERLDTITAPYCVVVVPLLVETADFALFDRILVINVPEETQIDRLMARDRVDADQARRILEAQASRAQRLAAATEVIENAGGIAELEGEVARLHSLYGVAASRKFQ